MSAADFAGYMINDTITEQDDESVSASNCSISQTE